MLTCVEVKHPEISSRDMRNGRLGLMSLALCVAIAWCPLSCSAGSEGGTNEGSERASQQNLSERPTSARGPTLRGQALEEQVDDIAYALENITYTQSDAGKTVWEMTAELGTESPEGKARLKGVRIVYFPEDDGQTTATAEEGFYDLSSRNAHLIGDVVITSSKGITVETQSMNWFQDKQVLSSEDEVIVKRGCSQIKGIDLEASAALGELKLRHVSGVLQMSDVSL